jgi:sugar phosphate isomerase/epimerase
MPLLSLPTINWVRLPDGNDPDGMPTATRDIQEVFEAAASAGFAAVGIDAFTAAGPGGFDGELIGELLRRHRLVCTEVGVLAAGPGMGSDASAELAGLAASTGARVCVTVAATPPGGDLVAALKASAEVLGEAGVRMALEFLPYGPLSTLADAVDICDSVGWERCGVLLDSWHFFNSGTPWEVLRGLSGEQIALVQINDAPPPLGTDLQLESRFRRVPPGAGTFPLEEFVATLERIGYRGVVSPEVLSKTGPVDHVARTLMKALQEYWPETSTSCS